MAATIITLADALVAAINAHSGWTADYPTITAERAYVPSFDIEEVREELKVLVVPRSRDSAVLSRADRTRALVLDVGFTKRAPASADRDALLALVEAVDDWCWDVNPSPLADLRVVAIQVDPIYDGPVLDQQGVFISIMTLTFREWR